MPDIKLSVLASILGLVFGLPHIYGVINPSGFGAMMRRFPRYTPIGYVLMMAATAWFLANLSQESVSDFMSFKPLLFGLFAIVGIGACLFVKDFISIRGLAVLMLLMAKSMVDSARWVDTQWRLVITVWAYIWVLAGIWFTVSPWRLRDMINWATSNEQRIRLISGLRLAFGVFVFLLGVTVYRSAESLKTAQTLPAYEYECGENPGDSRGGHWRFYSDAAGARGAASAVSVGPARDSRLRSYCQPGFGLRVS